MEATISNERYEVYQLQGIGGTLAIGKVPHDPAGAANQAVQAALRSFLRLEEAVVEAKSDKDLSAAGRVNKLKPAQYEALTFCSAKLLAVNEALDKLAREVESAQAAPELEPGDAAGALLDREIRERFAALVGDARLKFWVELAEGQHDRVLMALLRDPLPSPDREQAARVNADLLREAMTPLVEGWARRREDLNWAVSALTAIRQKARDALNFGVGRS